jgi:D-alanyl-lipoteichoic acid acyltransferase DltB (MBOAT superfamily)
MFDFDIDKFLHLFVYDKKSPILFNTGFFLFLFLVFYAGYILLKNRQRSRIIYVILFSWFFYYKSSGIYFLVLVGSTIVDYTLSHLINDSIRKGRKLFYLVLSLVLNLGMLAYFKYTNFLIDIGRDLLLNTSLLPYFNISFILDNFSPDFIVGPIKPYDIFLPVGVSFFTFQSLSYTIDVYKGNIKPLNSIVDYGFFVSFFPQLVAGPIVRASDFLPQIHKKPFLSQEDLGKALFLIIAGLIKKAVISDYISGNFVDRVFDNPMLYSGFENLMATYGYAMQIYCDFSGYSDMAIGIALLLGFHLPKNFNAPYISGSITEFWRRWHISLSSWLRDYLYISLGGNRKGKIRTYINLMLTMLLGGLWHGASLKFIIWGGLHGAALAIEKAFNTLFNIDTKAKRKTWIRIITTIITFHFVCFCWIFFRARTFDIASQVITQSSTIFNGGTDIIKIIIGYQDVFLLILAGYITHFIPQKIKQYNQNLLTIAHPIIKVVILALAIYLVIQVKTADIKPFIYFQF